MNSHKNCSTKYMAKMLDVSKIGFSKITNMITAPMEWACWRPAPTNTFEAVLDMACCCPDTVEWCCTCGKGKLPLALIATCVTLPLGIAGDLGWAALTVVGLLGAGVADLGVSIKNSCAQKEEKNQENKSEEKNQESKNVEIVTLKP